MAEASRNASDAEIVAEVSRTDGTASSTATSFDMSALARVLDARDMKLRQEMSERFERTQELLARFKEQAEARALSTHFIEAVEAAQARVQSIPFRLKQHNQPVQVKWQDLGIEAPETLDSNEYTLGQGVLTSESDLVQPIATLLFCQRLAHLAGQAGRRIPYACVDIHTGPSNYIWQSGTPDLVMCVHELGIPLTVEMINSSNTALIIELKSSKTIDDSRSLPQLVAHMETFLMKNPLRQHVYGLLTDLNHGTLVKVERRARQSAAFQYTVYDGCEGQQLVDLIHSILHQDPSMLDAAPLPLEVHHEGNVTTDTFHVGQHLGHGVSGAVLAIQSVDDGARFAIKGLIPGQFNINFRAEMDVMERVRGLGNMYLGCEYLPAWRAHSEAADMNSNGPLIVMELCEQLTPDVWIFDHVAGAIGALRVLHQEGNLIHRDLRPGNILVKDGRPIIIDFGCTITNGTHGPYQGSVYYGAYMFDSRRLQLHSRGDSLRFGPADDLISFVLTMFAIFLTCEGDVECIPDAKKDIVNFWHSRLPPTWLAHIRHIQTTAQRIIDNLDIYERTVSFLRANLGARPLWCGCAHGVKKSKQDGRTCKTPVAADSAEEFHDVLADSARPAVRHEDAMEGVRPGNSNQCLATAKSVW